MHSIKRWITCKQCISTIKAGTKPSWIPFHDDWCFWGLAKQLQRGYTSASTLRRCHQAILGMALKPCRLPQLHSCHAALYAHKILSNKTMLSVGELAHLADIIRILSGIIILAGWKLVLGEPLRQLLGNDLRGHRGVRNDVAPRGCWHLPAHVNVSLPFYVPRMTPYMDHMSRCAD